MEQLHKFKIEDWIRDNDTLKAVLNDALASGDTKYLLEVLGIYAKHKGLAQVADNTSIDRTYLYRMLSKDGNPAFDKIVKVFKALNLNLRVTDAPHPASQA